MNIKILRKKGEFLDFILEGTSIAFANALRRIMIAEVPTMSIECVEFYENNSTLYDEVIAHRLGMLPIVFDPKKFNLSRDCKCGGKGCPLCQVVFVLEKTGPCTVYSGDLKSSNKDVKPSYPTFPIIELFKDQKIKLEAIAKLGTGLEHSKWQAANVSYQYYPELIEKGNSKAIKICPKGALKLKNGKVALTNPEKCNLCESCFDYGVKIKGNENKFIFRVESISGLNPEYIVSKAAEVLISKSEEFSKKL